MQRLRKKMMGICCEKYVKNLMKWKNNLKTFIKQIYYQQTKKQIYKHMQYRKGKEEKDNTNLKYYSEENFDSSKQEKIM